MQGAGSPELWEGQVRQVAAGSAAVEQWCQVACVGQTAGEKGKTTPPEPDPYTHKALTLFAL